MIVQDPVYGEIEINDPVLLDLMQTSSIQRLKGVSQYGVPDKYYSHKNFSRYDHSVGVMLLLKYLGASIEEQVAGLLHDVSVLAFSHVVDWVFGSGPGGTEDYHDSLHAKFVHQSEIPAILDKYGFSKERVSDLSLFPLLENEIPDLCADRVDYALREFNNWSNPSIVPVCLDGLMAHNNETVYRDTTSALDFATNFLRHQMEHWGAQEAIRRYHLFSHALKRALDIGIVSEWDFYKDEESIIKKLEANVDKEIREDLGILSGATFPYKEHGEKVLKRFRYVDPKVIAVGGLKRLSELNAQFAKSLTEARIVNQQGVIV